MKRLNFLLVSSLFLFSSLYSETVCVDGVCTTENQGVYRTQDSLQAADCYDPCDSSCENQCGRWDLAPGCGCCWWENFPHRDETEEWMLERPDYPGNHEDPWLDDLSR